jgi:hypothetical protein
MRHEWAHVNVQREALRPVDDWHQDSMPFVLVTVLTNHEQDPGGSLIVRRSVEEDGGGPELKCKLRYPGESILMQGSHIWHKAEPSQTGERLTMVTSFVADSLEVYDTSSIRLAVQYTPPHECVHQFLNHALARIYEKKRDVGDEEEVRELVREKETEKIIAALQEIQLLVRYNRDTCGDPRMVAAFDRWLGVSDVLRKGKRDEGVAMTKSRL